MKGDFKIESKVQETFTCKCHSWRNDAISDGGGAQTAHAAGSSGNTVTVQNETVTEDIVAGEGTTENASNNTINISGDETSISNFRTYAGLTVSGNASGNVINIWGGNIRSYVQSGNVGSGTASNNVLNIYGGNFTGGWVSGAYANGGTATNNVLNIYDGNLNVNYIEGSWGSGLHEGNVVNIFGGTINGGIISGSWLSTDGESSRNEVNISGGTINNNTIAATYITSGGGTANNSVVNISGDAVISNSSIYGGWSPSGAATNNTINIYGSPDLSTSYLYAGQASSEDNVSGNNMNIYTSNITAKNIGGFENLNFILPSDATNGTNILTLTDTAGTDLSNTVLNVNASGAANFNTGDTINLITNNSGLTISDLTNSGVLTKGVSMDYDMTLNPITDSNGNVVSMNATLGEVQGDTLKEQTRMIGQTPVSNIQAVTIASEKLMEWLPPVDFETLEEDQDNPPAPPDIVEPKGFEIFMNIGLGRLKTKLGDNSFVKTNGGNYDLGAARHLEQAHGDLHIAPIIQYGRSHYDVDTNDMHGSGNTSFLMGGIIARKTNNSGFYYEGSFRAGRAENDFSSSDFQANGQKINVGYNASMPVFAGHVKLGNAKRLGRNNLLDVYGIYFFTRQNGTSADLSTGEHYDFSASNNHRIKLGYRLTTRTSHISRIYTGLAYQYERSSDSVASYQGYQTPKTTDKGSSGMLELGWLIKPNKNVPIMLDVNMTGWFGHQRGFTATAKFKKAF